MVDIIGEKNFMSKRILYHKKDVKMGIKNR